MKKKTFIFKSLSVAVIALSACMFASCLSDGDDTIILESGSKLGIPSDNLADPAPKIDEPTVTLPNAVCTLVDENGSAVMNIDMTGVGNANAGDWMTLYGTAYKGKGQNVWVSVDGTPKGIDVYNNAANTGRDIYTDIVFLVDNSGSMSEEAEAIARDIIDWSEKLAKSGLNARFGCVGYGNSSHAVDGALNITTASNLKTFLDQGHGTNRTEHFGGPDADALQNIAQSGSYENGSYNECGMVALHFANENFNFRSGANRIYVNFTDEPNQPNGVSQWSVEFLNPTMNPTMNPNSWNPANGTVHTVYSGYQQNWSAYYENPALMSTYTGGTVLYATSSFTDTETGNPVTLESLPVTGAMQNSYIIRFTNVKDYMDGQPHEVKVTVISADGTVKAEKTYWVIFQ